MAEVHHDESFTYRADDDEPRVCHAWSTEDLNISITHPKDKPPTDQILKIDIDGIPYDIQITRKD